VIQKPVNSLETSIWNL